MIDNNVKGLPRQSTSFDMMLLKTGASLFSTRFLWHHAQSEKDSSCFQLSRKMKREDPMREKEREREREGRVEFATGL